MNLVLVSQEYPPETAHGGIATQTARKAGGLAALGHRVHVITRSADGRSRQVRAEDGVLVTRLGVDPQLPANNDVADWILHSRAVAVELTRLHEETPIDLVDFAEYGAEGYVHLLNRDPYSSVATTVQLHGPLVMLAHEIGWPEVDSALYRVGTHMEATCCRLADAVYSSSRTTAGWCAREYGIDGSAVEIWHAGVNVELFRPGRAPKAERPTVVFAGRVARSKGADVLLRASLELVADVPGLCIRFVGRVEPGFEAELRAEASGAGAPALLEFAGPLPQEELAQELCRAHVFAAPSRYEGGPGLVYLEAMACGLPVVACGGSGVAEVVTDGRTGYLVPPGSVTELAGRLRLLLGNGSVGRAIGEAGRRFVEEHADTGKLTDRLEALYADVIRRRITHERASATEPLSTTRSGTPPSKAAP